MFQVKFVGLCLYQEIPKAFGKKFDRKIQRPSPNLILFKKEELK